MTDTDTARKNRIDRADQQFRAMAAKYAEADQEGNTEEAELFATAMEYAMDAKRKAERE